MVAPLKVIINGRFLLGGGTGVHRVAEELVVHVHALLAERPDLRARIAFELWTPHSAADRARALGVPHRIVGPLHGRSWEQITLPIRARGGLILSLCNVGVIATSNSVTMLHDAQVHLTPASYSPAFRAWYRFQQGLIGHRHRRILTVSDYSREQLVRFAIAPADRIRVIPNGIDHIGRAEPAPAILTSLGLVPGRFVVSLANTQAHKNIPMLLRAFADPRLRDMTLVLFGADTAEAFRALGHAIPDNVRFAGRVSDRELAGLFADALCMAFPSCTEGFGLPPLEAMRSGCPAVVAPAGALPEVCGEAALYADPHDPAGWVEAVLRLHDDPDLRAHLIAAGEQQAARFTWRAAAERLVEELLAL
ncbi:glycosyltransferase family 4 protein [Novosphingobium nitrogenifigens]|uniref:glycosyltransferase family 4 protein n=1 Tax=Novosphingobium nitrogenifigens TaxID=378548 RepID=UPI0002EE9142|nr:glycosyltransferase family 1 protein [Novosphingobium nitrogenifigens]